MNKLIYKDLGTIPIGQLQRVIFPLPENLNVVKDYKNKFKILTSCSNCTRAKYNKENSTLEVTFKPKKIPKQIADKGKDFYYTSKTITLYYIENGSQKETRFIITAKIVK